MSSEPHVLCASPSGHLQQALCSVHHSPPSFRGDKAMPGPPLLASIHCSSLGHAEHAATAALDSRLADTSEHLSEQWSERAAVAVASTGRLFAFRGAPCNFYATPTPLHCAVQVSVPAADH